MSATYPLLVFGEVLFDSFPDRTRVLGGAPFNVAWTLKGLGNDPAFISSIGMDEPGTEIRNKMAQWGLSSESLQESREQATGLVEVSLDNGEPSYAINNGAWEHIADEGLSASGLLYHGSLALRSEENQATFEAMVSRSKAIRFYDVNLRLPFHPIDIVYRWLESADWVKLNTDELAQILESPTIPFSEAKDVIDPFLKEFGISNVLLTAGKEGALLAGAYGEAKIHPAPEPESFIDAVGAGDSFSAVAIDGILKGKTAAQITEEAVNFARRVCGLRGATSEKRTFYSLEA